MKLKSAYCLICLFLLSIVSQLVYAQVTIPDVKFRNHLIQKYPSVMRPDQKLDTVASKTLTNALVCDSVDAESVDGIQYFTNIAYLFVRYNYNLKTLPTIDRLTKLLQLEVDSNALTSLPNLSKLTNLQVLTCRHNQLTVIPSLNGLTKIWRLFIDRNQLTTIPDLSSQINLDHFICSDNPLTELPSFDKLVKLRRFLCQRTPVKSLPDLSHCVALQDIVGTSGEFTELPDLSHCPQLRQLSFWNCKLNSLPNLSSFTNLSMVELSSNYLSFEDIVSMAGNPNFSTFNFANQNPGTAGNISALRTRQVELKLDFDDTVTTNNYEWYKDGIYIASTTVNKLILSSVDFKDAGVYTCKITNTRPALSAIMINAKPIVLNVTPCIASSNLKYFIAGNDCSYPIKVTLDESSFITGTAPFTYSLRNNRDTLEFNSSSFALSNEGIYNLVVTDAAMCEVQFDSSVVVPRREKCDPVFYPNGDGIADTYFIENSGTAKIYNKSGQLVKELLTPGNWDGTNTQGNEVPTGLYVIIVGNNTIRVTVLR